jgi:hypothetical protein
MLADVQSLIDLQETDRHIQRLHAEIAALPKRVAVIEEKLAGTKKVLEDARTAVKADETAKRKYESTISDLQGKISKYRDQSLDVKTNEQYKALLHEIQFAEQEIRGNEDKILELMVNADAREKKVKAAEAELKDETAEIEKEKAIARERTAQDEKELAEWNGKRSTLLGAINPDLLRHFERVSKFRGSGIAEVRDQKCMGCQVMLRPQTYNDVRGGSIVMCESCQRILYFNPANEPKPEPVVERHRRRARPKFDSSVAWFYHPTYGEHGEVLLGFENQSGQASRQVFDFNTGRQLGDTLIREGTYPLAFPEDLGEAVRLNGDWDEEEMETWGQEMPMTVLDALHSDLALARHDKGHAAKHDHPEPTPSEHPAAS